MPAIETAFTAVQTEAMCDDTVNNVDTDELNKEIHIVIQDRTGAVTMGAVYDALNSAFATVSTDDFIGRNTANFVISA